MSSLSKPSSAGSEAEADVPRRQRIVLFSCYYGRPEPLNPDVFSTARGRFPCYVFSDNSDLPVPEHVTLIHDPLVGLDVNRASRRAKLMPDVYLPPCDWSIYLDNNMSLIADAERLVDFLEGQEDSPIYITPHPERDCAFDEAQVCQENNRDDPAVMSAQMQHYAALGFPHNAGLLHGGFLIRRHGHKMLSELGRHWFEQVLRFSRRDQLSFSFVAQTLGITPFYMDNEFEGKPMYHWPVYQAVERRDTPMKKQSFWSRSIKPNLPWRRKRNSASRIAAANTTVAELYQSKIGNMVAEKKGSGAVLVKYEAAHGFDYETYREIQNVGNKLKIDYQWVGRTHLERVASMVREFSGIKTHFGLCHGTRRGNEQLWLSQILGGEMQVIGTEIADTAKDFPNTVQWDFHVENPEWIGKADFVYSNSWDHSYDPELAFGVWIDSLRPGGVLVLDWTEGHSETGVTEMDPFGATLDHLQSMLNQAFADRGKVVACREGDKHEHQQIWMVVFQKDL